MIDSVSLYSNLFVSEDYVREVADQFDPNRV